MPLMPAFSEPSVNSYEHPFFDTELTEFTEKNEKHGSSDKFPILFPSVFSVTSVSKFFILRGVQPT